MRPENNRTDSYVVLLDVSIIGLSVDIRSGYFNRSQVTVRTPGQNPLTRNEHSRNGMYIYWRCASSTMGVVCPVMACWTSIPEWSLGRSAHACSITCSGVAVGGHSRCRRPCRPVAVSRHNPTTRNGFLPHREALVPVCNPNRASPTHPKNGPAVRRLPFFGFFFIFELVISIFLKNLISRFNNI